MARLRRKSRSAAHSSLAVAEPTAVVDELDVSLELPTAKELLTDAVSTAKPVIEAPTRVSIEADFQLAQRCFSGEVAAWEQLHGQCHEGLLSAARMLLRGRSNDPNLADEIVAQVWYALVANDGELLIRFDPQRGARMSTFLRAIARDLVSRHFRSEHRRMGREREALHDKPSHHSAELDRAEVSLDEFLDTLAPGERQFYDEYLLDQPDESDRADGLTPTNVWQKTHRLYNKFRLFFGHGS